MWAQTILDFVCAMISELNRVWAVHLFCCCFCRSDTVDFLHEPRPDVIDIRRRFEADPADFLFLFYVSKRDLYAKIVCMIKGFRAGASLGENAAYIAIDFTR